MSTQSNNMPDKEAKKEETLEEEIKRLKRKVEGLEEKRDGEVMFSPAWREYERQVARAQKELDIARGTWVPPQQQQQPQNGRLTFEKLLERASETKNVTIQPSVIARCKQYLSSRAAFAVANQSPEDALGVYEIGEVFPSTETSAYMLEDVPHLKVNGALHPHLEVVRLAFEKGKPKVVKYHDKIEVGRMLEDFDGKNLASVPHLVQFQMVGRVMVMDHYPAALDVFAASDGLDEGKVAQKLWVQMSEALHALHALGLAHMDVKPSNIFCSNHGDFILGDIGSMRPFGLRTVTTRAFIPRDIQGEKYVACSAIDWWMLAMTFYDTVCEGKLGYSAQEPDRRSVRLALVSHELMGGFITSLIAQLDIADVGLSHNT